jgi:hypothetical protein
MEISYPLDSGMAIHSSDEGSNKGPNNNIFLMLSAVFSVSFSMSCHLYCMINSCSCKNNLQV